MSTSDPSGDLTRQQLDELDALLQRMLELPAHPLDENPVLTESAASLGVLDEEPAVVELSSPPPSVSLADSPFLLRNQPPAPATKLPPIAEPPAPVYETGTPAPAFWLWPLTVGDQVFDHCVSRLGRPGRWLRRPAGRRLLGWTGILMLAAAVVLFLVDWVRWNW